MLAGEIMNVGGMTRRIINMALAWSAMSAAAWATSPLLAAVLMASLSGSAVADTAALAALLLPMMGKAGHDKARAGGLIACGGIIAPVIPPSIGFVIFGVTANVSISKLFLAGIVPGLLMGAAIALTWWWVAKREEQAPPTKATQGRTLGRAQVLAWALFLPVIVLVGLKFGVFTPTEAAVIAAVYALFVGPVVYRELKLNQLYQPVRQRRQDHGRDHVPGRRGDGQRLADHHGQDPGRAGRACCSRFMDNQTLLLIAIMLLVIAVGTAMDLTPTILIMTPVLMPVVKAGGHRPGLLRRALHHEQRHRPDHAAGRHGAQRRRRRRQDADGRGDARRRAFHARAVRGDVPAGGVPVAGDGAAALAYQLTLRRPPLWRH